MRILCALTTAMFLQSFVPNANSQTQIRTEEHFCEGQSDWHAPACQSAWEANISAIFLGFSTEVLEEDVPIVLDGKSALTPRLHVTFRVDEAFIGVSERVVRVTSGGDLCGFPFSKGHHYLVYGRRLPSGEVYVSISSSTKWEADAAEDLLPTAPHGGTIHGTVFRYTEPENPRFKVVRRGIPAVGHKVEIHGASQSYEATVDARGNFELSGVPPGRYTVSLDEDNEVQIVVQQQSTTVDVADKGCARFGFWIDPFSGKESIKPEGKNSPN